MSVKSMMQEDVRDSTESGKRGSIISGKNNIVVKSGTKVGSLRVERTVDWFANTATHVNKLLSATFPHLCVHPSKKVRSFGFCTGSSMQM